jgi:hypothetical protein
LHPNVIYVYNETGRDPLPRKEEKRRGREGEMERGREIYIDKDKESLTFSYIIG